MLRNMLFASAAVLAAGSAQAVTYMSTPGNAVPAGQTVFDDFEHPVAGVTYSGSYTINKKTTADIRAAPAGDDTKFFATPASNKPTPGTAMIDLSGYVASHGAFKTLSFYWGSIDSFNTLTLLGTGLTGQTVFTGNDINDPANGDQSSPATNRRVTFTFASGEDLTGLKLSSGSRAFEIDNIAGNVPEPATWALMVMGFGLVGFSVRRRNANTVAA